MRLFREGWARVVARHVVVSARARTTELRGNEKSNVVVMALLPTDGLEPSALGSHRGESCRAVSMGGGELVGAVFRCEPVHCLRGGHRERARRGNVRFEPRISCSVDRRLVHWANKTTTACGVVRAHEHVRQGVCVSQHFPPALQYPPGPY